MMDHKESNENQPLASPSSEYITYGEEGDHRMIEKNGKIQRNEEGFDNDMSIFSIVAILSTAFSYGCVFTTLFLITLPIECERIAGARNGTPKSVALAIFVAIAGFTQLVSPLVGRISDTYEPPRIGTQLAEIGQRMPYYFLGAVLAIFGLLGQMVSSYSALWLRYGFCFVFSMTGLNIQYAMMIALIPDQVPRSQVGVANGILAFLLVLGSLFGFGLFHSSILAERVGGMYALYACINIATTFFTITNAHDKDASLTAERIRRSSQQRTSSSSFGTPQLSDTREPISWPKKAQRATKRVVRKAKQIVLTPAIVMKSMMEPLLTLGNLYNIYTIDTVKYHDFYIVTISRLFYYCGMSVQTFFLYFVHDILHVQSNPEAAVATLAILGQCTGALTCYPVGFISDRVGGRRKPFVYVACALLASATLSISFITTFHQMVVVSLVLGAANGMYLTMDTSLAVDTLPENDDTESAQLLGIWGVAAFLGSALGPMVSGPLLSIFSEDSSLEGKPEEYSRLGYALVYVLSALYFTCSALALRYIQGNRG